MNKLKILISIICAMFVFQAYTQTYSTQNKRAIAAYEEAIKQFELRYFDQAELQLQTALKIDNTFSEAYYLLAGVYMQQGLTDKMIATLQTCVNVCADKTPWALYKLAFEQFDNGIYAEAKKNIDALAQKKQQLQPDEIEKVNDLQKRCDIALELLSKPVNLKPKNMGSAINSQYDDFHPAITVDEELFILTSNIPFSAKSFQEDMFYSVKEQGVWTERKVFPKPITTLNNEGAQSISADGNTMVFTACNQAGGKGSCDIYITYRVGNQWIKPQNIGSPVNTRNWESQPSLSADGRTLYFVSNRPGGFGKKDIWVSTLTDTNTWTPPVNLGPTINTKEEEESPYIHADGKTLFFSSDGHFGMGKKDMFVTQKLANGSWRQPINMGYPLNTHNKESHVVVNAAGTKGYFASNQFGTLGGVDIFEFDIDETFPIKPSPVTYIKGVVYDAKNIDKKVPALIQLSDIETGEVFYEHVADFYTGSFIVPFYQDKSYALTVTHHGYLLYSEQVNLKTIGKSISIPMQPIAIGNTVVLNNVFFDTDSYSLKPESKVELLAIVDFMNQNPLICFEIGGHTDNVGNKQYNTTLSNNRAKAVYDFIVEAGISSSRLSYKGYADNKPVVDNTTPENRAKNRRTELVITKF